ncbi:hypothetical protein KEM48_011111 [Puccinia striiformis f. sp. tritici PST-130]|nr:hypothetical protein KEM48_011111 [Puccinia striiformis f. sp. tritici PST-130]
MSVDPPSDNNDKPNDIGPDGERSKLQDTNKAYRKAAIRWHPDNFGERYRQSVETNTTEEERETMKAEWSAKQQANSATQPAHQNMTWTHRSHLPVQEYYTRSPTYPSLTPGSGIQPSPANATTSTTLLHLQVTPLLPLLPLHQQHPSCEAKADP